MTPRGVSKGNTKNKERCVFNSVDPDIGNHSEMSQPGVFSQCEGWFTFVRTAVDNGKESQRQVP